MQLHSTLNLFERMRVFRRGVMRRQVRLGLVLVFCLAFLLCTNTDSGQAVYGSLIGTGSDPQGNAVAGAKVTVTSVTKSFTDDTSTNESGNYSVTHLIPDTYKIKVEASGFKVLEIPSVGVSADNAAHVDAQLQVGAVTQSIEVTGEVPQLKTDRADVDMEFSQTYVEELPVLNRNFTNFELHSRDTKAGWLEPRRDGKSAGRRANLRQWPTLLGN